MISHNVRGFVTASTLALACGAALGQCPATFAPAASWPMAGNPYAVAVGDFNHDGRKDLAAAISGGAITIRFGDINQPAGANFQPAVSVPGGTNQRGVVAGDLNHDGIDDLATIYAPGPASPAMAVMISNGNGTFQPAVQYPVPYPPYVLRSFDINHDGTLDMGCMSNQGVLAVLVGNANGTFQAAATIATQAGSNDIAFGDFNGDGAVDLAMSNYNANGDSSVAVALGLSPTGAAFGPLVNTGLGSYGAWGLARGDFNGDSREDLVVTHSVSFSRLQVLLSNADGTPAPQTFVSSLIATPIAVATADFNGDGRTDVAAVGRNGSSVVVYMGRGDGTLTAGFTFAVTAGTNSIAAVDMNNDGKPDIVTADSTGGNASILMNTTATFAFTQQPFDRAVCPGGTGTSFHGAASTTQPGGITGYRWEKLVGSTWTTIAAGTSAGIGEVSFDANSSTMFILNIPGNPGDFVARLRLVALNGCGSLAGNPVELRIINPCGLADIGMQGGVPNSCGDGILDNNDFIVFIGYFFNGNVLADRGIQGGVPGQDALFDNNDFVVFIDQFFSGCMH